jgi:hypothetical protein
MNNKITVFDFKSMISNLKFLNNKRDAEAIDPDEADDPPLTRRRA